MINTPPNSHDYEAISKTAYLEAKKKLAADHEDQLCNEIAQDVAAIMCTRSEAEIRSPLAYARTLAQRIADTYLRKRTTHRRFLQRAAIPSELDTRDDPATEIASREQREQLRTMLLSLDVLDTLHLLAVSLSVPAHEVRSMLHKNPDSQPSIATTYSQRNRALQRAREKMAV